MQAEADCHQVALAHGSGAERKGAPRQRLALAARALVQRACAWTLPATDGAARRETCRHRFWAPKALCLIGLRASL